MDKLAEHIGLSAITMIVIGGFIGLFAAAIDYLTSF